MVQEDKGNDAVRLLKYVLPSPGEGMHWKGYNKKSYPKWDSSKRRN
jgi:hypothetical protein